MTHRDEGMGNMKSAVFWLFCGLSFVLGLVANSCLADSVQHDARIPQLAFSAQELGIVLKEAAREHVTASLTIRPDTSSPEAYEIKIDGDHVEVIGSDANGTMYGAFEVAECLKLGLPLESVVRSPLLRNRGIKMNIPWDCRTPSYCDKGTAAQSNIVHVWDFEGFWKPFLDSMARYRYNVLSLWSTHPYPSIIRVPGYEDCALSDVYRVKESILHPKFDGKIRPDLDANGDGRVTPEDGTMTRVVLRDSDAGRDVVWRGR